MSQVEALSGVAPYARYGVASEEVEPAMGWAYAQFLSRLANKPTQTGADLAKNIVKSYIVDDVRIQDDAARADFVLQLTGKEMDTSAEEVGTEMSKDVTLTAVNLQAMPAYMKALNNFAVALTASTLRPSPRRAPTPSPSPISSGRTRRPLIWMWAISPSWWPSWLVPQSWTRQ